MRRVVIESPYAASKKRTVEDNVKYAREAMLHSLRQQEAPFASHLLYTQCLDDATAVERSQGIAAGLVWGMVADLVACYCDFGLSRGMLQGLVAAKERGTPIVYRFVPPGQVDFAESLVLPDLYAHDVR